MSTSSGGVLVFMLCSGKLLTSEETEPKSGLDKLWIINAVDFNSKLTY